MVSCTVRQKNFKPCEYTKSPMGLELLLVYLLCTKLLARLVCVSLLPGANNQWQKETNNISGKEKRRYKIMQKFEKILQIKSLKS